MENWSFFDEELLLESRYQVLRSYHHGSKNGTQWERLERLDPSTVIVSSNPESTHELPDLYGSAVFTEYDSEDGKFAALTDSYP
jgi:beta-lactamase superfamily II metal-dependent hydrolase